MHGLFFVKFKEYVLSTSTPETWDIIAEEAGVSDKDYDIDKNYPDHEILTLVASMATVTKKGNMEILEEFGDHISGFLLQVYKQTLNIEGCTTIQLFERLKEAPLNKIKEQFVGDINIPLLDAQRIGDCELIITYKSPRQFCAFLKGIIKGVAQQQNEDIFLEELDCTMNGSAHCRFLIRNIDNGFNS